MDVLNLLISIVLVFLSGVHFYWAIFGIRDIAAVVPTRVGSNKVLSPGKWGAALVGVVFLLFAFVFANKVVRLLEIDFLSYVALGIGILFLARAIGDFNYIGFTKRVKNSKFSSLNTKYYSPFCLFMGLLILFTELLG